jgi:hypothetical protein
LTVNGEISIANGGESKYHINYYQGGLNFAETGVQDRRIHIGDGGNVGIGTATPGAKLGVNGDLKVTGAYKGDISSSTNTDGAPFPRPAYNSGWISMSTGEELTLTHNIGGEPNDYMVDLQMWSDLMDIHNYEHGCDQYEWLGYHFHTGVYYCNLTASEIKIRRGADDSNSPKIRVRIWVIE